MAVVQISKIQVRRGRKTVSGIPQLAGGELGWAVDTQELFIGNGAVSEGSPAVGNTKILTINDNIIDFALKYQYKLGSPTIQTGPLVTLPVQRTMQAKIDEIVSIKDFGAVGNGVTDDTQAIQRAIDQLYRNSVTASSVSSRVILRFDAGVYKISSALDIPSYATLTGSGIDKTIIRQIENFSVIKIDQQGTTNNPEIRSKNIDISNMTLETIKAFQGIVINNASDCVLKELKIKGAWNIADVLSNNNRGIDLRGTSILTATNNVKIDNCVVEHFSSGLVSEFDVFDNRLENCTFRNLGTGVRLGVSGQGGAAQEIGPHRNIVSNSLFKDIKEHGINILKGYANISRGNSFVSVGNDGGDYNDAVYPVIYLDMSVGIAANLSVGDFIDRSRKMSTSGITAYVSDISGSQISENKFTKTISVPSNVSNPITLFRLPTFSNLGYKVHYLHRSTSNNTMRFGVLTLVVNKTNNTVKLTDEYDFSGNGTLANNLQFYAQLVDIDGDLDRETIRVQYINQTTTDSNANSFLNYWYQLIS